METICDKDGFVANAWRGMQFAPDELARYCDWPVNHADLNARRKYLNDNQHLLLRLCDDPEYYDAKMAGYWIWAMSCWIGSGLVRPKAMPDVTNAKGVHKTGLYDANRYPDRLSEKGVHKKSVAGKRPALGNDGIGINHQAVQDPSRNRPQVALQGGIHALCQVPPLSREGQGINQQIPLLNHETGVCRRPTFGASGASGMHKAPLIDEDPTAPLDVRDPYTPGLYDWFRQLSERLRRVRVVCGDWTRVCGGDWQDDRGICGLFFDPPYDPEKCKRDPKIYTEESATVANDVREWCRKRGALKTYRIVLAGYYEEHVSLLDDGWTVHRWSAHGGFANRGKGKSQGEINRHKEALFFSPHCYSDGLQRFVDIGVLSDEVPG